ncbi:MAG: hypothetical protein H6661_08620 [Ardenticatenaceae bacterium]|nr:hypothetical protein [Ardenticatenaceae bacterium]
MAFRFCFAVLAITSVTPYMANQYSFGRYVYAIGGNPDAARLSGINILE